MRHRRDGIINGEDPIGGGSRFPWTLIFFVGDKDDFFAKGLKKPERKPLILAHILGPTFWVYISLNPLPVTLAHPLII